jgi:hypothetical protein
LVNQPVTWSTDSRLILDAQRTLTAKEPIAAAGNGGLTLVYGDGDSSGDLQFFGKGKADLPNPGSNLIINGSSYALVYDIAGLANGIAADPNGHFALAADYDAGSNVFKDSPVPSFAGAFEGLGHTISRVTIDYRGPDHNVGFFGVVTGFVRDVLLTDEMLRTHDAYFAGGLVGTSQGQVIHARVTGKLTGEAEYAGGLIGYNGQQISKSSASVMIRAHAAGGLVGNDYGQIDQCFAAGRMIAPAGGLVGLQSWNGLVDPMITNSYASAHLPAGVGGLIGTGMIFASSSYSTSELPGFGGFVGSVWQNHVQNAYWDIDTSGQTKGCGDGDCSGITGLSDAQLKSGLPAGFDPKIWGQSPTVNNGYPYLLANPPPK